MRSRLQLPVLKPTRADLLHESTSTLKDLLLALYTESEALEWLFAPQEQLGGKSAIEMVGAGKIDEVLAVLHRVTEGVYL